MSGSYEMLDHTGDAAVKIIGDSIAEVFEAASRAMFEIMGCGSSCEGDSVKRAVTITGLDKEDLLVRWLSELNFLVQTKKEIYSKFEIERIENNSITGRIEGRKILPTDELMEIKAVTYHRLYLKKTETGFEAFVVFDL